MSIFSRLASCVAFAAILILTGTSADAAGPGPKQFFRPQSSVLAKLDRAPGVVSDAVPIQFNAEEMLTLRSGEEIQLTLPNATSRTVVFEVALAHGGGMSSWAGYFKERGDSNRVIITTGPAGSYGVIDTPDGSFRVIPGEGHDWLVDMTQEQLHLPIPASGNDALMPEPQPKGLLVETGEATWSQAIPGVTTVGLDKAAKVVSNIDILFVVTTGLANKLGAGLMTRLNFLVTRANTAYADSGVEINLRMVGVTVANYTDSGSNGTALDAISPGRPGFDSAAFGSIETFRTQVKADVVAMLRDGSAFGGSGIAWVGSTSPTPTRMYSVTTGCVAGCETVFIHEVGHNMGNMHDRATVAFQAGGTTSLPTGAQTYSYGYAFCKSGGLTCNPNVANGAAGGCGTSQPECAVADSSNFREIMAYFQASTQHIYKFSNPAIACQSTNGDGVPRPCGVSEAAVGFDLVTGSSNTALSMNSTKAALSAINTGFVNPPGILFFKNAVYSGTEAGGSVAITVSRSNGSGGAISVPYTFASGSALAGVDFTATSGSVSWVDGDTADKTITVPVANDGITEGNEAFTVTLGTPTGNASLGYPFTTTGVIAEPWPPGGTAPVGFSSAVTPTLPWAVASDSFDGTLDTVSFKSGAFASSATGNSSTQYTGNFAAGTVAFSYRVSSYPGNGFFEFLIDGTVIVQDSGDSGWKGFATQITAGNHTLEWRYRKTLGFFCANAIPAPPQGAACADRTWIDTVTLPLAGAGGLTTLTVNRSGTGTVTSSPAGVDCGATCSANFNTGTVVTLTASPGTGFTFTGWSGGGACSGTGNCVITLNSAVNVTATFTATATNNPPRLGNISTRGQVLTGNDVMIGGFIIGGTAPKTVVVRARGPSLIPFGITNALANPAMQLYSGQTQIASNDDWGSAANASAIQSSGFAPGNALESAILATLNPGAYTAIVSGVGGGTGVGIVEVFEVDHPEIPLVNISTRGQVRTGNDVMIGGFIIQGNGPQTVIIRARGPSLIPFGITNALADPTLQLFSGQTMIASNDDWGTATNAAQIQSSGFAPSNPFESAILVTLNPGAYTAIVSGFQGGVGVGIVEVFAQ